MPYNNDIFKITNIFNEIDIDNCLSDRQLVGLVALKPV